MILVAIETRHLELCLRIEFTLFGLELKKL